MNDVVVGTLGKGAVDVAEGLKSVFSHSSGEGHGMAFGYSYVEYPLGHLLHHDVHGASCGHGGCHAYNVRILLSKFQECLAEYALEFGRLVAAVGNDALARVNVELAWGMPNGGLVFCGLVAVSFLGMQVQQLRTFHVFQLAQQSHYLLDIMSVEWSEVADVHALEDVLLV